MALHGMFFNPQNIIDMAYFPEDYVIRNRILYPINLLQNGVIEIDTIPAGFTLMPITDGALYLAEVSGTGLGAFTVSVGTNASSYNNLFSSITPGLGSIVKDRTIQLSKPVAGIPSAGSDVKICINVSGVGIGFTALKGIFYLPYIIVKYP